MRLSRISKAIGSVLGGVTGGAVVFLVRAIFDVELDGELAAAIALIASAAGTWLAPANSPPAGQPAGPVR